MVAGVTRQPSPRLRLAYEALARVSSLAMSTDKADMKRDMGRKQWLASMAHGAPPADKSHASWWCKSAQTKGGRWVLFHGEITRLWEAPRCSVVRFSATEAKKTRLPPWGRSYAACV
jgi:hypothetical protein